MPLGYRGKIHPNPFYLLLLFPTHPSEGVSQFLFILRLFSLNPRHIVKVIT